MTLAATTPNPLPDPDPQKPLVMAVITNVGSTQNQTNWIEPYVAGEPGLVQITTSGPADIDVAVGKAAAVKADVIIVNGGDGTADLVFSALLNRKTFTTPPAVALLAAGKTNMTAAAWSFDGDKVAAIKRILAARRKGSLLRHITHRPILTIETGNDRPALRGAFLGAADVVNGILFCREHIYPMKLPNPVSHALALGILFWRGFFSGARAEPMEARWDDGATGESGKFFFISATTLDKLIIGLSPQPDEGAGALHYLSLRAGAGVLLKAMPKLVTKNLKSGSGRMVRRTQRMTLTFDGAYTLDGELYKASRSQPLTISANETLPFIQIAAI